VGIYIARRLLMMPLLLLGLVTVAFVVSHTVKADPLSSFVSERQLNNPEVVEAAKQRWGLDKSLPEQYVIYIKNLLQGDMGTSFRTRQNVREDLQDRLPATIELTLASMTIAVVAGVTLGVVAATRRNSWVDHSARLFALVGSSLPVFWTGLFLLFIFYAQLGWLPGPGRLDTRAIPPDDVTGLYTVDALLAGDLVTLWDALQHLLLPSFVLGWAVMGIISRLVRASMLDILNQDYVRTARAKGLQERRVVIGHALRNALIPTLTIIGISFAVLITGAVLTETVFNWPGVGSYSVEAAGQLDFPAIMGVAILGGVIFSSPTSSPMLPMRSWTPGSGCHDSRRGNDRSRHVSARAPPAPLAGVAHVPGSLRRDDRAALDRHRRERRLAADR
jgi:peptide/nickel transport system permease protein